MCFDRAKSNDYRGGSRSLDKSVETLLSTQQWDYPREEFEILRTHRPFFGYTARVCRRINVQQLAACRLQEKTLAGGEGFFISNKFTSKPQQEPFCSPRVGKSLLLHDACLPP